LRTVKAVADRTRIAEIPTAEAVAWTSRPQTTPMLVTDARRQPSATARRATSAMSGPGETVTTTAATVNAAIWPSTVSR
jgi:hypothetical protein